MDFSLILVPLNLGEFVLCRPNGLTRGMLREITAPHEIEL